MPGVGHFCLYATYAFVMYVRGWMCTSPPGCMISSFRASPLPRNTLRKTKNRTELLLTRRKATLVVRQPTKSLPLSAQPVPPFSFLPVSRNRLLFFGTRYCHRQVANRVADDAIAAKKIAVIERQAGQAVLRAIITS